MRHGWENAVQLAELSRPRVPYVAQVVLLAALYFVAAKLALLFAIPPGYATALWRSSGVALAAVLLFGQRVWPGIWLGAALANLGVQDSLGAAIPIAFGNTIEAIAAAALIKRDIGVPFRFERGQDVVSFVALTIPCVSVAATVGVLSLVIAGSISWEEFLPHWWTWMLGDAWGIMLVTPLALSWSRPDPHDVTRRRALEIAVMSIVLLTATLEVFGNLLPRIFRVPLPFMLLPIMLWVALRFGQREITAASATICVIGLWSTLNGRGAFASAPLSSALLILLAFSSTVMITGLLLNAILRERMRAMEDLELARDELAERVEVGMRYLEGATQALQDDRRIHSGLRQRLLETEQQFRLLVEGIQDYAIFMLDPEGYIVSWNAGAQRIKGYVADEIIGLSPTWDRGRARNHVDGFSSSTTIAIRRIHWRRCCRGGGTRCVAFMMADQRCCRRPSFPPMSCCSTSVCLA